jgi:hypothetical protein
VRRILVLAASLVVACGARTGLRSVDRDAGPRPDAFIPPDARPEPDAPFFTDAAPPCRSDLDCDDHVVCTGDHCAPGGCTHDAHDAVCDDGLFCNGRETCALTGCLPGMPQCIDAIDCTDDACIEASQSCTHTPNDARCPLSNICDPVRGCLPRLLAQDPAFIYNIALPSGDVSRITRTQVPLTDIALAGDGTFYGATSNEGLVRLDPHTGATTPIVFVGAQFFGLEADPTTDTLYGGSAEDIVRFDLATGTYTVIARLPAGEIVSGDLAFIGGRMLVTTTTNFRVAPDDLFVVPLDMSGPPRRIGNTGHPCIFGLAVYRDTLYGLTCEGLVLTIDPMSAASAVVSRTMIVFDGGAAR